MKRWILSGSYPESGGWNDYVYEFATKEEAQLVAVAQLKLGCDAHLSDESTGEQWELSLNASRK